MGKGSTQRPSQIPKAEWNHRWDLVFDRRSPRKEEGSPESTPKSLVLPTGTEGAS